MPSIELTKQDAINLCSEIYAAYDEGFLVSEKRICEQLLAIARTGPGDWEPFDPGFLDNFESMIKAMSP